MAILGFELEEIARMLALLETRGLDELVIQEENRYLRIRGMRWTKSGRARRADLAGAPLSAPRSAAAQRRAISTEKPQELPSNQIALVSPMVGVFYRAEKPDAPPLVDVGQHVSIGQSIGIIEAMKIFSEVPAEHAGRIVAIPAPDGQLVQAGSPLVILEQEE
jgi:acetyl-CoA carboxylase biotin carboxyl carrier protein